MKKREKSLNLNNLPILWKILLYVLITVFFVSVVFIYYRMIVRETRENIINEGRINAAESSSQIDKCMLSSMDVLTLAAYTLDNMIRDNRSQEDILDYMTTETIAVSDSLITNTTGIYGYINGEYMDGSGWIPEEGYDPTSRPWYTEARAGGREMVLVDPYVDLDTGTVMIALVKTLRDGESVVGIDLSMDLLQKIIEDNVSSNNAFAEFIVNSKGTIISHSNILLIGNNINSGEDPLSKSIADKIRSAENGYFYLDYAGRDYMIYVMPLETGWTCVSVIDATDDFAALRIPLVITILISVIIIAVFLILLRQSEKKSQKIRESLVATERAMAANEAKTSFLSNMSHEIRTPINAILGMNEMILRESDDDSILEYSENIKSAGSSLLGIINDVLDFSKIEAGKIEILPVNYDLSVVINDLVNMICTRANGKGLDLKLDFNENIPRFLNGDEVRLKQIITNILTNAVKYTEKGSITFSMDHEMIPADPQSILLKVSVKDTGIGIKQEDIEKLFTKFERIEERRNRNIEGTGLGLNITQSLLSLMGSTLEVSSVYGQGSEFGFSLKQKVREWEPLGNYEDSCREHPDKQDKYKQRFIAPKARVLVVDDNPMNLTVFRNLIKQTKICIDTAESGEEGIRLTKSNGYDMIFLDHMMPGKDGIETLREIRTGNCILNSDVPTICLTANAISGAREEYLSAGFDDYLTKPIDSTKLEEMLIHFLPDEKIEDPAADDIKDMPKDLKECTSDEESAMPDALKAIDGDLIDVKHGLTNSGNIDLYMPVLRMFLDTIDEYHDQIDGYYNENDIKDYTIKVHALKSSARIIGADHLADEAQELENAGKSEDMDFIREHNGEFLDEYLKFKPLLEGLFEKDGTDKPDDRPVADPHFMAEAYDEIKKAADDMDCERLENIFEEMKEYSIPDEEKELFESLCNATGKYDYESILKLLSEEKGL